MSLKHVTPLRPISRCAAVMDTSRVQPIKLARVRRKPGFEGPDEGGRSRGTGWSRSDPSFFIPGHQGAGQDRFAGTVHAGELERRGGGVWGLESPMMTSVPWYLENRYVPFFGKLADGPSLCRGLVPHSLGSDIPRSPGSANPNDHCVAPRPHDCAPVPDGPRAAVVPHQWLFLALESFVLHASAPLWLLSRPRPTSQAQPPF